MLDANRLEELGIKLIERYEFDLTHYSLIGYFNDKCIIVDNNLCLRNSITKEHSIEVDYAKYCEMQNKYMAKFNKLYRFNYLDDNIYKEIEKWLNLTAEDINIEASAKVASFDKAHIDSTILEEKFADLFVEAYGNDALCYLKREYPISLADGKNAFVDYVVETKNNKYAIEENGITYHHPQIIGNLKYERQLIKQNTLNLYGFKVYRFSTNNMLNKDQVIDNIKEYLGSKDNFINSIIVKGNRKFKLYEHQEKILDNINEERKKGINTSLVVIPTGTGKSQIVIEDLTNLVKQNKIKNVLIMVPSLKVKDDWSKRLDFLNNYLNIEIKLYNAVFISKSYLNKDYYDYICFDEAHHAQAFNCKKTLQYFTPRYLIGLTATPERLDGLDLEEIFGEYETSLTLKDAILKDIVTNIRCYRLKTNIDLSEVRYNGKDYNYADLEKTLVIDSRNEIIVDVVKKYFSPQDNFYKQGIIFCVNVSHAKKLEKLFSETKIKAKAVYGGNKNNEEIFNNYKNKKIQFLLTCQLISEGWDSPQTEVIVMARPTLSKVLYMQQLGRGVRKYQGKECLYVIDVVDDYVGKLSPWNFNSLFKIPIYMPFAGVRLESNGPIDIFGLNETEMTMEEVDIFTFEEKYGDYLSLEQAARELFIGTETLRKWTKENLSFSSLKLPLGNKMMPYYSKEDIINIRKIKGLKEHNNDTILEDFLDFIDENTLTFSFKLIFMLNMFKLANNEGEVNISNLVLEYTYFYQDRLNRGLKIDKDNCVYNNDYLKDFNKMKKSILANPFEKFERKRFVYYSKDLNIICFNPILWQKLTKDIKEDVIAKENKFLKEYYENLGGL